MKKTLLNEVLRITKLQEDALKAEDMEKFQALLDEKQKVIDQIEALHKEHPETKEQKEEVILKEIIALDDINRKEFMRQYEEVQRKLQEMRQQKKAKNKYHNPYDISYEEGIFYDKR